MPKTKKRSAIIRDIKIVHDTDCSPDFSHIGEYTSEPGPEDRTINREERGDMRHGEYRYFVAAMSGEETGNPKSVEEDYKRMEDYNRQEWGFLGIRADATLYVNGCMQKITSAGLWGIESDSGNDYFEEVAKEQLAELTETLKTLGFTSQAIKKALPAKLVP